MNAPELRKHHPYSPSTLQAREACPKFTPAQSDNEASRMGTLQHDAVEAEQDNEILPDHRAIAVAQCIAYSEEIAKEFPGGTILKEAYLPIDSNTVWHWEEGIAEFDIVTEDGQVSPGFRRGWVRVPYKGTTAGYCDFAAVSADATRAAIIDYKFGAWAVEAAENNTQGISYALGLLFRFPNLKRITVYFLMPHRDEIDKHTFVFSAAGSDNRDNLLNSSNVTEFHLWLRIHTIVARAIEAHKEPLNFDAAVPTTGTCRFCALVGQCPKVAALALKVSEKYGKLDLPVNFNPTLIHNPTDTKLGLQLADVVNAWAKSFRARATAVTISTPDFIPDGYNLVQMQRRKVKDATQVATLAKAALPPEMAGQVDALLDIAITNVEELIKLAAPRGSKERAAEKFSELTLSAGAVEMGRPYAFLKMSTKGKSKTESV